jgi:TolB-like protein/DNA-binding winged helix-turn-helix (wHTH) protein
MDSPISSVTLGQRRECGVDRFVSDLDDGFRLEDWDVHPRQNLLTGPAGQIHLTPRCMDVLVLLARRDGQVVDRDEFSKNIWHPAVVTDDALTRHISTLRKSLGDDPDQPRFIETIPKRGYRLVAAIQPLASEPTAEQPSAASVSPGSMEMPSRRAANTFRPYGLILLAAAVGLAGLLIHTSRQTETEPAPSIAVLPFEAFGMADDDLLTDGLHHDLLTRLSHIDDLRVISRTSVKRYDDTILPITDIAEELGVAWIVEGAVQRFGDEIQLNAQLIEGASDSHVWAKTYRRDLSAENIFAIQSEIVEDIAASLEATLSPTEEERLQAAPTENLASYTLAVQGRAYLDARTEDGAEQALVFFRNAIQQDPDYAIAWVGLADALTMLHDYGYRSPGEVLPEAEAAIERALDLNPDLAEAHASLGALHSTLVRMPEALRSLKRATALRPGYAEAHNWLSWNYQLIGMASKALESAKIAVELNPFSQEAQANLVGSLIGEGRFPEALLQARFMDSLSLPFTGNFNKALALYFNGKYRETIKTLEPMQVAWAGGGPKAVRALAHVKLGEQHQATILHEELLSLGHYFSAGLVLAALGDVEAAFAVMAEIDYWDHWPALAMNLYLETMMPDLVNDPRFADLLSDLRRQHGLDDAGRLPAF